MLSATDALFTLQTASKSTPTAGANHEVVPNGGKASAVTGICFVRDPTTSSRFCNDGSHATISSGDVSSSQIDIHERDESSSETDSSDEESCEYDDCQRPLQFRCSSLLLGPQHGETSKDRNKNNSYQHATHVSAASHTMMDAAILASCHLDGSCKLWDLATRRCIDSNICRESLHRGGSGLALRRIGNGGVADSNHRFLYQTRDPLGTVSLRDLHRPCTSLLDLHTYSISFCIMAPCHIGSKRYDMGGVQNLVALPTEEHSVAVVRDLRCDPKANPAWRVAMGDEYISAMYGSRRKYGMLTSLALCAEETTQRIVLGCGMENGSSLFYDLGALGHGREPWYIPTAGDGAEESSALHGRKNEVVSEIGSQYMCSTSLGKDPVLCLDLVGSNSFHQSLGEESHGIRNETENRAASVVAVAGCAGDADELSELPEQDQGTISAIKVKLTEESSTNASKPSTMKATIRSKTRTCSIASGGKVGVSICRFRPDGRIYAVGGWDHRLRLFSRTSSKPLAILRGHEESVTAVDWAKDAASSGLLATGAGDGRICVWRVFPHSLKCR